MITSLLSMVLAAPDAAAGCTGGRCVPVPGVETPTDAAGAHSASSSLVQRPDAHLRTATFALG